MIFHVAKEKIVTRAATIGDVIMSQNFECGYHEEGGVFIDGLTRDTDMGTRYGGCQARVAKGAYDETRKHALFVVEAARAVDMLEPYEPAWYVEARRVSADGSHGPSNELIRFFQCGPATYVIPEVELVGRVKTK